MTPFGLVNATLPNAAYACSAAGKADLLPTEIIYMSRLDVHPFAEVLDHVLFS